MIRLLKAEFYKLKKNRTFKILLVISFLISLLTIGTVIILQNDEFQAQMSLALEQTDSLLNTESNNEYRPNSNVGISINYEDLTNPTAKEIFLNGFGSGTIQILMVVLIASLVAKEYSKGTIKNTLAYGRKREEYYVSKIITGVLGSGIILFVMSIFPLIYGAICYDWGTAFNFKEVLWVIKTYLSAFIVLCTITSLITLLATLLKSNGSTISTGIVIFTFLPLVTSFLYGHFTWFDNILKFTTSYNFGLVLSRYATNSQVVMALIISVIVFIISTLIGCVVIKKQDIK